MDIDRLKLFIDVANKRSFAAVARDHDQDPSTISRTISGLETELGIRLFQRTTRSMTLTEAGEIYRNRVETLIDYMDDALEEARSVSVQPTGTMRITSTNAFGHICLMPLVPELRREFPNLRFDLQLADSPLDLVANRIDLAIRLGNRVEGDVIATKLFDTRYLICASPSYLQSHEMIAQPADIIRHHCLLFRAPSPSNNWVARHTSGKETILTVDGEIIMSSMLSLLEATREGYGPSLFPEWMVKEDLVSGRLVNVLPEHQIVGGHTRAAAWLVYPSKRYLPYKVRAMVDFLKRQLSTG